VDNAPARSQVVSHSVHGLLTVVAEDAPAEVTAQFRKLFGPSASNPEATAEADIHIRFVAPFPRSPALRYVGLNEAAYDGDHFYLLDDAGRRMRLGFERVGEAGLELICERGMTEVPLLFQLAALRLLRKGHVVLHAAAFVHQGKSVLATGWRKGGKTELLLAFTARGADFVSDEWTILSADGVLRGLPTVAGIWDWHFRYLPEYWSALSPLDRGRLRLLRSYRAAYRFGVRGRAGDGVLARAFRQLSLETGVALLGQVRPRPERLFGDRIRRDAIPLDHVLFPTMADSVSVRPVSPTVVARRMVASQAHERRPLFEAYERFRFAYPERRAPAFEGVPEEELRLLEEALAGRPAHEVSHPYPVPLPLLYETASPYVR
jgi:hypothetical protein